MTTENQLVVIEKNNALQLFTTQQGLDPVLKGVRELIDGFTPDTSTAKGRQEIASLAHSVARSKTYLDGVGKELVTELKEKPKLVDAERKRIRDLLDEWKDEVRAPLTKLENAERGSMDLLDSLLLTDDLTADEIQLNLDKAQAHDVSFAVVKPKDLEQKKESVIASLANRLEKQKAFEAQQAELERIRIEEQKRLEEEREQRIRQEAAEQARKEAEESAQREREKQESERLERERQEQLKREAEQRKADEDKAASERREMELKLQVEAAERRAAEAAEAERRRIESERKAQEEAAAKAAANKEHRKRVNNEILFALGQIGLSEDQAKAVITAAVKGEAGRLTVNY